MLSRNNLRRVNISVFLINVIDCLRCTLCVCVYVCVCVCVCVNTCVCISYCVYELAYV